MSRKVMSLMLLVMIVLGFTSIVVAQEAGHGGEKTAVKAGEDAGTGFVLFHDAGAGRFGGPIGAGLVLFGGAAGISRIGVSACESIARQPEAGGRIFTSMIITAAMIEGATFFGVLVCLLAL